MNYYWADWLPGSLTSLLWRISPGFSGHYQDLGKLFKKGTILTAIIFLAWVDLPLGLQTRRQLRNRLRARAS